MSETNEDVKHAFRKLCFQLAEDLDPGDEPYDVDEAAKTLEMMLPMTRAEAEAELEEFKKPVNGPPRKPSQLAALKAAFGVDDAMEAIRRATHVRCQVNACHQVIAENDAQLAVLTQRAEQAEEAVDANWVTHQQVIAANNRAFAAKAREKRLREGIEEIVYAYSDYRAVVEQPHKLIADLKALLAQPSDGKEAEDGK